ncbi:MAG TPA: succinate dehydrogenase cytochrome b subunit [Bacteroidales bacterium]|nr:succinate dehydrogenase cytochrome b subunit [Bacteroidales bacterium]
MGKSAFYAVSIGQKVITALAGLFLMTFLAVHLATNLLLIKGDGGASFREAVRFLTTSPIIRVMEVVLFSAFIIHIVLALFITLKNWLARPVGYFVARKSNTYFMSRYMFHTGMILLAFLLIHLWHFFAIKAGLQPQPDFMESKVDFYPQAVYLFQKPIVSAFYLVSFIFLGFHLNHALQSGFQTLGLNHNRYTPVVKIISALYSVVISVGFAVIPLYFLFFFEP